MERMGSRRQAAPDGDGERIEAVPGRGTGEKTRISATSVWEIALKQSPSRPSDSDEGRYLAQI